MNYVSIGQGRTVFLFFCVPQLDLWGSPVLVRFLHMGLFFNPTIEVAMFCLSGLTVLKGNKMERRMKAKV